MPEVVTDELKSTGGSEGADEGAKNKLAGKDRWQTPEEVISRASRCDVAVRDLMRTEGLSVRQACAKVAITESFTPQGILNLVLAFEEMGMSELISVLAKKGYLKFFSILEIKKAKAEYGLTVEDIIKKALETKHLSIELKDIATPFTTKEITDAITAITNRPERVIIPRKRKAQNTPVPVSVEDAEDGEGGSDPEKDTDPEDPDDEEEVPAPAPRPAYVPPRSDVLGSSPVEKIPGKNSDAVVQALSVIKQGVSKILGTLILAEEDPEKLDEVIRERVVEAVDEIRAKIADIFEEIKKSNPEFFQEESHGKDQTLEKLQAFMEKFRAKLEGPKRSINSILEELANADGFTTQNYRNYLDAATFTEENPVLTRLMKIKKIKISGILELRNIYKTHKVDPLKVLTAVVRARDIEAFGNPRQKYELIDIVNLAEDVFSSGEISDATNQLIGESKIEIPNVEIESATEKGATFIKYGLGQLAGAIKSGEYNEEVVSVLNYANTLLSELVRMTYDEKFPMEIPEGSQSFTDYLGGHEADITHESPKITEAIKRLAQAADRDHGMVFFSEKELGAFDLKDIKKMLERLGLVFQEYEIIRKSIKVKGRSHVKQSGYRMEWKTATKKIRKRRVKIDTGEIEITQTPPEKPAKPAQQPAPTLRPLEPVLPIVVPSGARDLSGMEPVSAPPSELYVAPHAVPAQSQVEATPAPAKNHTSQVIAEVGPDSVPQEVFEYELQLAIGTIVLDVTTENKFRAGISVLKSKISTGTPTHQDIDSLRSVIDDLELAKEEIPIKPWQESLPRLKKAIEELISSIEKKIGPAPKPVSPTIVDASLAASVAFASTSVQPAVPVSSPVILPAQTARPSVEPPSSLREAPSLKEIRGMERGEIWQDSFIYEIKPNLGPRTEKYAGHRFRRISLHHRAHRDVMYVPESQIVVVREQDFKEREPESFFMDKRDLVVVGTVKGSIPKLKKGEEMPPKAYKDNKVYKVQEGSTSFKGLAGMKMRIITVEHPAFANVGKIKDKEIAVVLINKEGQEVGWGVVPNQILEVTGFMDRDQYRELSVPELTQVVRPPTTTSSAVVVPPSIPRPPAENNASSSRREFVPAYRQAQVPPPPAPHPRYDDRRPQYQDRRFIHGHHDPYGRSQKGNERPQKAPVEHTSPWWGILTHEFTTDEGRRIDKGTPVEIIPKTTDQYKKWLEGADVAGVGKKSYLARVGGSEKDIIVIPRHIIDAM